MFIKKRGMKMRRRKEYSQIEKEFMDNIKMEYILFKSNMLLKSSREIYDSCSIIYFYECIYEYFQYNENVNNEFINLMHDRKNIIAELKDTYNEFEYLTVNTWDGIADIICCCM